jgi:hypothetical protein
MACRSGKSVGTWGDAALNLIQRIYDEIPKFGGSPEAIFWVRSEIRDFLNAKQDRNEGSLCSSYSGSEWEDQDEDDPAGVTEGVEDDAPQ